MCIRDRSTQSTWGQISQFILMIRNWKVCLLTIIVSIIGWEAIASSSRFHYYNQCDQQWSNITLANPKGNDSTSKSICKIGSSLTSAAMALTSLNRSCGSTQGSTCNPAELNAWLFANHHFDQRPNRSKTPNFDWRVLKHFGLLFEESIKSPSDMKNYFKDGQILVVRVYGPQNNVLKKIHSVLMVGIADGGIKVYDPMFGVTEIKDHDIQVARVFQVLSLIHI
eukprot:TRINITY_DN8058_c0_g1_i2.p1 TRINITY_DN8058_c0_g1~~TRINITY_DN8058_c0_g1_i2.p1  ORF type:complete len:224 (+),score=29.44 TRINITY_DN8058_c0_g1_i2:65-736(+)